MGFSGVLLPDGVYEDCDRCPQERKSDWMYRKAAERGILTQLLADLSWTDAQTPKTVLRPGHAERRPRPSCGSYLLTYGWVCRY